MNISTRQIIRLVLLFAVIFLNVQCGEKKSDNSDMRAVKVAVGDVFIVDDNGLNIFEKPDKKSDIIDIQESGNRLKVISIQPDWVEVKMSRKGLLRVKDGEFTGWVSLEDLASLKKKGGKKSDKPNIEVSGRRSGSSKSRDGRASGSLNKRKTGNKDSEKQNGKSKDSDRMSRSISGRLGSPGGAGKPLEPLVIQIVNVTEYLYDDVMSKVKLSDSSTASRFSFGFKQGMKIIVIKLKLKNPNFLLFPSSQLNWKLKSASNPDEKYMCKRPFRIFPECRFRYPGGIIRQKQQVDGGVSFIVPDDLEISDAVLIYNPRKSSYFEEFPLHLK